MISGHDLRRQEDRDVVVEIQDRHVKDDMVGWLNNEPDAIQETGEHDQEQAPYGSSKQAKVKAIEAFDDDDE